MAYLNLVIGLGGSGVEIFNEFLKIVKRYPLKENYLEWFLMDTASLRNSPDYEYIWEERDRFFSLRQFQSSKEAIDIIKANYPESNIGEIFPPDSYVVRNNLTNSRGCWYIRQLGYLSFLYDMISSPRNIFRTIFNKITNYPIAEPNGIRIFVISSLAGGTRSGIFLPFSALLSQKLREEYPNVPFQLFNFLFVPSFISHGSRNPNDKELMKYRANTYQALVEINKLINTDDKKQEWKITLDNNFNLDYRKTTPNFIQTIFLFDEKNTMNMNLARYHNLAPASDKYKIYFQLAALCLYAFANINAEVQGDVNNHLLDAGHPFSGMGMHAIEFPYDTIADKITKKIISILLRNISKLDIPCDKSANTDDKNIFIYKKYQEDKGKESTTKIANRFKQEVSRTTGLDNLRVKEPDLIDMNLESYLREYRSNIVDEIIRTLDRGEPVNSVIRIVQEYERKNRQNIDELARQKAFYQEKVDKIKSKIQLSRSEKAIRGFLIDDYFGAKMNYEMFQNCFNAALLIDQDLVIKRKYFENIIEYFGSERNYDILRKKENYFNFPPPRRIFGDKPKELDEIAEAIFKELLNIHTLPHGTRNDVRDLEERLVTNVWLKYSEAKFNSSVREEFLEIFRDMKKKDETDNSMLKKHIDILFEFTKKSYLAENCHLIETKNNIIKKVNTGEINKYIDETFPFIDLNKAETDLNSYIFYKNLGDPQIDVGKIDAGFGSPHVYDILGSDKIVLFFQITGRKGLERNLRTEEYRRAYEDCLKEDDYYKYSDAQFEEKEEPKK